MLNVKQILLLLMSDPKSQFCLFGPCKNNALSPEEDYPFTLERVQSPKRIKTSLKRSSYRHGSNLTNTHSKMLSPPATIQQSTLRVDPIEYKPYIEIQIEPQSAYRPPYPPQIRKREQISYPLTPKPKINFSWNTQLDQTVKRQQKQEQNSIEYQPQNQLQKTRPTNNLLNIMKDRNCLNKASVISIQDVSPKGTTKVEESVIMVDYFNPDIQRMKQLEKMLENKDIKQSL